MITDRQVRRLMKYRGDEQVDKRAATMVEHLMGSKVMLREPAGEPWGEGARRRASIWFYPLGFRISAHGRISLFITVIYCFVVARQCVFSRQVVFIYTPPN